MRCLPRNAIVTGVALACLSVVDAAQATILTFTQTGAPNQSPYSTTLAAYGDNVDSTTQIAGPLTFSYGQGNDFTPNIELGYSHVAVGGNNGPISYLDGVWSNPVNYLHAFSGSRHFFTFTPDIPQMGVVLNSTVIDLYTGIGQPVNSSITWNIRAFTNVGAILATGTETGWTNGENRLIDFGGTTHYGTTVLEFVLNSVGTGSVGIDDLNFDQIALLPEPGMLSMSLLGAAVLIGHPFRRRRSSAAACQYEIPAS